jgi:hypothetical protein
MAERTPAELVKWAWLNRTGELCKRDLRDILSYFQDACKGGIVWVFEANESISGLVLGTISHETKEIYVSYCRMLNTHTFKTAFKRMRDTYPGYTMLAHRYGTLVKYPL